MSAYLTEREEGSEKRLKITFKISESMQANIVGDTISELITALEAFNNAHLINEFASRMELTEEQFGRLDAMILDTKNAREIDRYLRLRDYKVNNVDNFEKALLEIGNIGMIVNFSQSNQGAYFKKMEEAVIASGQDYAIYSISRIQGSDLKKIKQKLWELESVDYCLRFYKDHKDDDSLISEEDVKLLEKWAIESNAGSYIYNVAEEVDGVDIDKLLDAIVKTEYPRYIRQFASLVDTPERISKLQAAIIEKGDAYDIYNFASEVKGANIKALYRAIIRKGDRYNAKQFREKFNLSFFCF